MNKGMMKEAIAVFKLNVEAFPDVGNPYDSLAEAYMKNGDKELAVTNYNKSLQLDPNNSNAKVMLEKLKALN
jgi:cytochrome c-type biogenesis protein CcmH/NrfG